MPFDFTSLLTSVFEDCNNSLILNIRAKKDNLNILVKIIWKVFPFFVYLWHSIAL